ncbi:DegT/DnrJ/EryC1/StrS family aminotransferase [Bacillus sp. B6(2022)]|nr:DegT/DnrJ/EryC1/StrS family aminotransferase [Bacillus sp. B6(2022)]
MQVLKEVLSSGRFTSGPYIPKFEKTLAAYLGKNMSLPHQVEQMP